MRYLVRKRNNPAFAEKSNLGVICKDTDEIRNTITGLLENDAEKLNDIINSQRKFINPQAAEEIIQFILEAEVQFEWKLEQVVL